MNKSLIALVAAAALAATVGQAEAGFRIGIGFGPIGLGAFSHNHGSYHAPRRVYRTERVQERAPVRARKVKPTVDVAKEDKPAEKTVAQNENSSITVAAVSLANTENSSITVASTEAKTVEPVKTVETKKSEPAVAQRLDCKKFFPSVGLTLTVPCE